MTDECDDFVIVTKLRPPPVPVGAVERGSLVQRVARDGARLTLVVGSAGWGKSTLLAQWCASQAGSRRLAFVGLDRLDDDPVKLWLTVVAALHAAGLGATTRVPMSPQAGGPGLWEVVCHRW
jgi:LuxR family maltose regulon positive regulatory protein